MSASASRTKTTPSASRCSAGSDRGPIGRGGCRWSVKPAKTSSTACWRTICAPPNAELGGVDNLQIAKRAFFAVHPQSDFSPGAAAQPIDNQARLLRVVDPHAHFLLRDHDAGVEPSARVG